VILADDAAGWSSKYSWIDCIAWTKEMENFDSL